MAEFKKLSEVEEVESISDNATVLVEDGGEIKRVPKTAVGGSGVGGYVIKLENSYIGDDGAYRFDESYDELYDVLMAGGSVWVDYTNAPEAIAPSSVYESRPSNLWDATNWGANHVPVVQWNLTDVGLVIMDIVGLMNDTLNIYYPNGSHNLEPGEQPE